MLKEKRLESKEYQFQLVPEFLADLTKTKFIFHKDKKLKTDYIIDLISTLILKYYFKGENLYIINAQILKDRYGALYNYYVDYLIDNSLLKLEKNHISGIRSRTYSLSSRVLLANKTKYKNKDKFLLKKYKKRSINQINSKSRVENGILFQVKNKLVMDLFSVSIDEKKSIEFIEEIKSVNLDAWNKNMYTISTISNGDIFYHFDKYGRMHTNFTILKSFIRKNYLKISGKKTMELDIPNSQPLFLCKLIKENSEGIINKPDFRLFKELTMNGKYYNYITKEYKLKNKKDAKSLTYKVLFGRNLKSNKFDILFKNTFPNIYDFIVDYKIKNKSYKKLSHSLQSMESNLIFNKIVKTIIDFNPEIEILTIHDSIVFPEEYSKIVTEIFNNKLLSEFNF